ncbi:MAG: hypothetical protein ACLUSP_07390 [Christensenellales bacterium]
MRLRAERLPITRRSIGREKSGENLYFSVEVRLNYTAEEARCFAAKQSVVASLLGLRKLSTVFTSRADQFSP